MAQKKAEDLKALVVGLGKSGRAAADMLYSYGARVDLYDAARSETAIKLAESGDARISFGDRPSNVKGYDILVLSPGVPTDKDFVKEAEEDGAEIIGELELAYRYGRGNYIAITGTNGKTTTTTLAYEIYKEGGLQAELAGNIGIPVASRAMYGTDDTYLITECSSFQLETTKDFHPSVSAILNITPDHLDRHKTMENYIAAKAKVFENQTSEDYFIYNADDEITVRLAEKCPARTVPFSSSRELEEGAFVKSGNIVIRAGGEETVICGRDEIRMPGEHNLQNTLAAAAMAFCSGVPAGKIASAVRKFRGVEHRMEDCGMIDGVRYINDSKGTNPDAAIKAVNSYENIILIAGGYDKKSSYDEFTASFKGRVKALVLIGVTAPKIRESAERAGFTNIYEAAGMGEAVSRCAEIAVEGDTVLLSPACASWDMYPNFEARGRDFKNHVDALR
ncbi:MAG: UDP-N-acetylmuramoyl-L-alanine--D-glutamate ligase [Firmicutes bacterium]|nr:UDP-N-acetylmuramoyl-L-alanine--D-glutamate ligase [Bacillota bacterium]